jgi:hypothetical protein
LLARRCNLNRQVLEQLGYRQQKEERLQQALESRSAVPHFSLATKPYTMGSELLQIQVAGENGLERDVIVTAAMPLFHLHRVLQFCIKPHQSDDTIAGQVRQP